MRIAVVDDEELYLQDVCLKIEKLKADKEAEIARGLEEIVKAKKMNEILFPCYVTISGISKN